MVASGMAGNQPAHPSALQLTARPPADRPPQPSAARPPFADRALPALHLPTARARPGPASTPRSATTATSAPQPAHLLGGWGSTGRTARPRGGIKGGHRAGAGGRKMVRIGREGRGRKMVRIGRAADGWGWGRAGGWWAGGQLVRIGRRGGRVGCGTTQRTPLYP